MVKARTSAAELVASGHVRLNGTREKSPGHAVKPGDVITKVDGALVDTPNKLSRLVAALDPGSTTHVEVVRDGKRLTLNVALSERRDAVVTASLPQRGQAIPVTR